MKKIKLDKETVALILITILSTVLNFGNLGIEGTGNAYYAAAVKSMTMSFENFFFVAFDPSGFVTIDKPPMGFWFQAISAKIFGFSGWSIILPQALAGVISVVVLYHIVKRSFGKVTGLISAMCLAITPVFVATSRNNTVDNVLVLVLLLACWAMIKASEKGKFKYLVLSMVLVGLGFNIKMLQAYMVIPAFYITYFLATATTLKKRIIHLMAGTLILITVSLSWALIVDAIPASNRPYVDSSTNNTVMELIFGHNGIERLSLSSSQGGPGGNRQAPQTPAYSIDSNSSATHSGPNQDFQGNPPPNGGGPDGRQGDGPSGLQGNFGGQLKSSIIRLFSKNILSDQIVWFILLAVFGFIASAIKEKLNFKLSDSKKQSLVLWFMWFLPVFLYFSFNTGTFHSYYLTMLAPPVAALTGIGITTMWGFYKDGGWKSWFLPVALVVNGAAQLLMLTYFITTSSIVVGLMISLIILCFGSALVLLILNLVNKKENRGKENIVRLKKILVSLAMTGLLVTPLAGSVAALYTGVGSSFPAAGLELLSNNQAHGQMGGLMVGNSNSSLVDFLVENKTSTQKYLLVVSTSNSAADIIIKTGEPVMAIGGFLGNINSITLDDFIELVKKGEVRYVMTGDNRGGNGGESSCATLIMNWVKEHGTVVSSSAYSDISTSQGDMDINNDSNINTDSNRDGNRNGFGGPGFGELYDLKSYTDSVVKSQ